MFIRLVVPVKGDLLRVANLKLYSYGCPHNRLVDVLSRQSSKKRSISHKKINQRSYQNMLSDCVTSDYCVSRLPSYLGAVLIISVEL
jgi:hypothetical protein